VVVLAAAGFVLYLAPAIAAQMQHLAASLPRYAAALKAQLLHWLAGLEQRFPAEYAEVRRRSTDALRQNLPRLATSLSAWLARVLSSLAAGLANVIPYMSLAVGLLPAMALVWAEYQSGARVLGVVLLFSATQLLEGAFLSPRILGRSVDLHPVWVLLAIIVGGSLFGLLGMLIAVPAAAAIQVFARHWLAAYRRSQVFRGDDLAPPSEPAPPA
jgi:predicted PurR-regulated permease PerM